MVFAWAMEQDIEITEIKSNLVTIHWPPRSGKTIHIPEVDKDEWFDIPTATQKINPAQSAFISELINKIK